MKDFNLEISNYNLDFNEVILNIKKNNYKKILLQIPEGLKPNFKDIINFLESKTNSSYMISADPCFGACDLYTSEMIDLNVDCAIQLGHLPIPNIINYKIPTFFINAKSNLDISKIIEKAIPKLKGHWTISVLEGEDSEFTPEELIDDNRNPEEYAIYCLSTNPFYVVDLEDIHSDILEIVRYYKWKRKRVYGN